MPQYKLTYYDLQGLGEPVRYLFKVAGVDFEDNRIPKDDTTYPKLPQNIKDELPWGSLPVLEVDGKKIAQSGAILRFLANRFNLAGSNEFEKAQCDELWDAMRDFGNEWRGAMNAPDETKKAEALQKLKDSTVPFYLGKMDKIVQENGKWLVGKGMTWIDIATVHFITLITTRSKMPIVEGFPALKRLMDSVYAVPQIKAWMAERPNTE